MSAPTHLEGYLRTDEDNLTTRMNKAFTETDGKTPFCVNIYFKDQYSPGKRPKKLNTDGPIVCTNPVSSAVDPFVVEIEAVIVEEGGDEPIGYVLVQGYLEGAAKDHKVNFRRTLIPIEMSTGDPNQALLQYELNALRARNRHLEEQSTVNFATLIDSHKNLAKNLVASATVRTASTASADLSSIAAIVGLVVLVVAKPVILKFFGFEPDATADQVGNAIRGWLNAEEPGRNPVTVPERALSDTGDADSAGNNGKPPLQITQLHDLASLSADVLLASLEENPELLDGVLALAAAKPELMAKAWKASGLTPPKSKPAAPAK